MVGIAERHFEALKGVGSIGETKEQDEEGTDLHGGRAADFVAFDCTGQDTAAYGHVGIRDTRGVRNGVMGCQKGTCCPVVL